VTFDVKEVPWDKYETTAFFTAWQPFDAEYTCADLDDAESYLVWPMHLSRMFVTISDVDMENADNVFNTAIFDKLYEFLEIHFVYSRVNND